MGLFSNMLDKLGFDRDDEANAAAASRTARPAKPAETPKTAAAPGNASGASGGPGSAAQPSPPPKQRVDVIGKLETLAASSPQRLNWRESIVDLMKLLNLDSSLAARKELAAELGCPADKMSDSAQMNIWLHKAVLRGLAENGGNVPKEMLN